MRIDVKLDKGFEAAFTDLKEEFGEEFASLNGLSDDFLNNTVFIDNFVDKASSGEDAVADVSIDGNANVGKKDIVALENEMSKPTSKLLNFNKIFYEMDKKYGYRSAYRWLREEWNGSFYLHDAYNSTFKPYCYSYDIERLVNEGLYFIANDFNNQPPKHLTTYTDFVAEFISWTCNRSSGAVGLPSFLIYSYYFWKKDIQNNYIIHSPEYYRDQEFQRIIYKLNQPYLRSGSQSAFTNFSIFDKPYLTEIFGGKQFPDGSFIIDYIDEIREYQKAFMEVLSDVREANMMTFPVMTYALLYQDGKFVDEEFAKWCCAHNMKWADSNFFVSENINSLSNCCFGGEQYVLVRINNHIKLMTFADINQYYFGKDNVTIEIFHNGFWSKGRFVKLDAAPLYKVRTANGKDLIITHNHVTPTLAGDKKTTDLTIDDYVMFNNIAAPGKNTSSSLSYSDGYLVGAYFSDGYRNADGDVIISLQDTCIGYVPKDLRSKGELRIIDGSYVLILRDQRSVTVIEKYIGQFRLINMDCIDAPVEFRQGIIDAVTNVAGGAYCTPNKIRANFIEAIYTSLGIQTTTRIDGQIYKIAQVPIDKSEDGSLSTYKVHNNSVYFKIDSIERLSDDQDSHVFCFEMEDETRPYFTLPNGAITHNCRLIADVDNLGYFNSVGGTALEVGSVKVNTINLARIAYESSTKEEYIAILKERTKLCLMVLDVIRGIMIRNKEKGLLPNYSLGVIDIDAQYVTIGINGLYEALQEFRMTYKDSLGYSHYTDEGLEFAEEILAAIHEVKDEFAANQDYMVNIEQIPGERAASILMEKDKLLFPHKEYELPLYGNQWIPLGVKTSIAEKVKLSARLDKACSGGSIAHINIDAPFTEFSVAWETLNYIAAAGVQYFAYNLRISACENNHGFYGTTCPVCGKPKVTSYQRIVGFLVPEHTYSKERKAEFKMRDWFSLNAMREI